MFMHTFASDTYEHYDVTVVNKNMMSYIMFLTHHIIRCIVPCKARPGNANDCFNEDGVPIFYCAVLCYTTQL